MHCLQAILELRELSRMAKVMGVESVAIGLSCRTGMGKGATEFMQDKTGNLFHQRWGHFSGLGIDAPLIP